MGTGDLEIAVIIPCRNEETTIGKVVREFKEALPNAAIYVCDNGSNDQTPQVAEAAGATVIPERRKGKGFAIFRLLKEVNADLYVMVDGDLTYPANDVDTYINYSIENSTAMLVANRLDFRTHPENTHCFTPVRMYGNRIISAIINQIFDSNLQDTLSGFRVLTREFVQSIPWTSSGFEIEVQLTIHALAQGRTISELPTEYRPRPEMSVSKLHTFRDGAKILLTIFDLFKAHRPLLFFVWLSLLPILPGCFLTSKALATWCSGSGLPSASMIAITCCCYGLGLLLVVAGLILDAINLRMNEIQSLTLRKNRDP